MIALLLILASWAVLAVGLIGIGSLVLRFASAEPAEPWRAFWVGFAGAIAVLQGWHIVAAVNGHALALLGALAVGGLAVTRPSREATFAEPTSKALIALTVAALWLADRSLGPPVGDAGLYHLSAIRWAREFAAVPGLANLHCRLGFNNPSLLWTAVLDIGGFGTHISLSLLVAAVLLRGLVGLARLGLGSAEHADAYWALLLTPVVAQAITLHELRISSPDPDTAMALVAMAAGGEFVIATVRPNRTAAFTTVILAVLAGCLKLSAAPFATVLALVIVARRQCPPASTAVACGALIVPWIVRGAVLTGYPLYPLAVVGLPVDWRVPAAQVRWTARLIHEYFMPPAAWRMMGGGTWVRGWLLWQVTRVPELLILPAVATAAMLRFVRPSRLLWLVLPCAASFALWVASPAPRFAYAFAWIVVAVLGIDVFFGGARARMLFVLALVLPLLPIAHRLAAWSAARDWTRVRDTIVLIPSGDLGFASPPKPRLGTYQTRSGLIVSIPLHGDLVWDAPLPATPEPQPDLALRRPPDLGGGFAIRFHQK